MKTLAILLALSWAGWASAGEPAPVVEHVKPACKDGKCQTYTHTYTHTYKHCQDGYCAPKYVRVYPACYGGSCGPQVYLPQTTYAPRISHRYGLFGKRILRIRY